MLRQTQPPTGSLKQKPGAAEAGDAGSGSDAAPDARSDSDAGVPIIDEAGCFGSWTALPSNLRSGAATVTVGNTVHVLGGQDGDARESQDWARLDTSTGGWSHQFVPSLRQLHGLAAVVGTRIVAVNGQGVLVFDTVTNAVTPATTANFPAGMSLSTPIVIAAGAAVFMWDSSSGKGALYNPVADTWTPASTTNAPATPCCGGGAWTGSEVVLFGGATTASSVGARYNPTTTTWSALPSSGAPAARVRPMVEWTGSDVLVYGDKDGDKTGGRYRPGSDDWISALPSI